MIIGFPLYSLMTPASFSPDAPPNKPRLLASYDSFAMAIIVVGCVVDAASSSASLVVIDDVVGDGDVSKNVPRKEYHYKYTNS